MAVEKTNRASTGPGRPSPAPPSDYFGTSGIPDDETDYSVTFFGEDGRTSAFRIATLPLPGWHPQLAEAWAQRVGPAGRIRTKSSADGVWRELKRFMNHLAADLAPPKSPSQLTVRHVESYRRKLAETSNSVTVDSLARSVGVLFELEPLASSTGQNVREALQGKLRKTRRPTSGYSDREFKSIVSAARSDVARARDRLSASTDGPFSELQCELLRTGVVPVDGIPFIERMAFRRREAEKLFITKRDLVPILALFVIRTGWNVEAIKELPADHRVLDGRAVELELVKRRRGPGRWHNSVTWEIGPPGRELRTPGGLYLLLHRLMAPARELLPGNPYWAVWAGAGRNSVDGVRNPFERTLNSEERNSLWTRGHSLFTDQVDDEAESTPLSLSFPRLKKSVDVRRTKAMGGHLPSAAVSNTAPVLFRNYLSGDATTTEWAAEVIGDAFVDVEKAALERHRTQLEGTGSNALDIRPELRVDNSALDQGSMEGSWSSCKDHEHHPLTGRRCQASLLSCFHCSNSVITPDHLPRILSLLQALEARRDRLDQTQWWERYGSTWTAIRYEVLSKFTESELQAAEAVQATNSHLDLVDPEMGEL